ncbi:MAG: glutathione S-transferase [Phenylobacterium sp.]|nr:glutathione S-transferase [Phenylobacterium sp.]
MLTLHGMGSPNVLKVVLMLEEAGLPYAFRRWDVILGEHRTAEFQALNPNGRVPVLEDAAGPDGEPVAVFESGAILIYLAEKTRSFLPQSGAGRHVVLQWLMFQMANLGPVFGHTIHLTTQDAQELYAVRRFSNEMKRLLDVLETRLGAHPFVAGPEYSIADMAVFPWLNTLDRFYPALAEFGAIQAWRERIRQRPAAGRMIERAAELSQADRLSFRTATPEQLDRYFGRA